MERTDRASDGAGCGGNVGAVIYGVVEIGVEGDGEGRGGYAKSIQCDAGGDPDSSVNGHVWSRP